MSTELFIKMEATLVLMVVSLLSFHSEFAVTLKPLRVFFVYLFSGSFLYYGLNPRPQTSKHELYH
jgi:hypothetical protein